MIPKVSGCPYEYKSIQKNVKKRLNDYIEFKKKCKPFGLSSKILGTFGLVFDCKSFLGISGMCFDWNGGLKRDANGFSDFKFL